MIFATSYVVALCRPGFERKGQRIAFVAGAHSPAGGTTLTHLLSASVGRIDEDMPLCDRDLAASGACGQPKIHRDRAGRNGNQRTPLIS